MTRKFSIEDVKWAKDKVSPDYRHLETAVSSESFEFSAEILEKLCRLNSFDLEKENGFADEILFGLRGCRIACENGKSFDFVSTINLVEAVPNHKQSRCVLGVWKRSDNKIAAFPGSTVPFWEALVKQIEKPDAKISNLLSTGLYRYIIGTHRKLDEEYKICGVFRQEGKVPVLRTKKNPVFDINGEWDFANVGDNIHPSRFKNPTDQFSSEGCLTVPGGGFFMGNHEHDGLWSKFRKSANLHPAKPCESEEGKKYLLILLTGREAKLAKESGSKNLTRLRFGSFGEKVKKLQTALKNHDKIFYRQAIDGEFGIYTAEAFINWQKYLDGEKADGIVTPKAAQKLGFDL